MPRIFDNIDTSLLPAIQETIRQSYRADFCVGYFNLRGWQQIDQHLENWSGGENRQVRLMVGMQRRPQEDLKKAFSLASEEPPMDNGKALKLKKELAMEFRNQLMIGAPTNADEIGLKRLLHQLKNEKLVVKLFLRHSLHAKLYLLYRDDFNNPITGFTGSSNLTFPGLSGQGELNLDVLEQDAANKLSQWFEDRWNDHWCIDITEDLVNVLEESWAGDALIPPYYIYLKMAYHLSQEARAGLSEFAIPRIFGDTLFDYQVAAVKIAARHLNARGGVMIGDVVGLGKTLMATALAKICENDLLMDTLIICPKNLVKMWKFYRDKFRLHARVISITMSQQLLPELKRYRLVIIDESHNLRNREGKRYRAIREYIHKNDSRCILLTATPYNKSFLDIGSQLRLFLPEDADLGIRPERLLKEMGEIEFRQRYQANLRSIQAFEKSPHADDWRDLLRYFLVRRTRSFIRDNYALTDSETGRKYLKYSDGSRDYFPIRHPKSIAFSMKGGEDNQYARLYSPDVVELINTLTLPRYGLANYIYESATPTDKEEKIIEDLSRGGRRLMGFCRTNLLKRLESSGYAFLLSVENHILRNLVYIYALENHLPIPVGPQSAELLDTQIEDEDIESIDYDSSDWLDMGEDMPDPSLQTSQEMESNLHHHGSDIYRLYQTRYKSRFRWIRSDLFKDDLLLELRYDVQVLTHVLELAGEWDPKKDTKLDALFELLSKTHREEKVIVFSQFADTVDYLANELEKRGLSRIAGVTGNSDDPTELAWRFSPVSNDLEDEIATEDQIRVLISTDVLSEGQNLQDAHIVVNYDLPWAIIRLVQRAGRVDRIGQKSADIYCYMFWPVNGIERIIDLRGRLRRRLEENAEVIGSDEFYFEDQAKSERLSDLYNEKSGILDEDESTEVDLVSHAYQIWKNATDANPKLKSIIPAIPGVVFSAKAHAAGEQNGPPGILVYIKDKQDQHALIWMDEDGNSISESQFAILKAAQCSIETPALVRIEDHHKLVRMGVEEIMNDTQHQGTLGRPAGAKYRTYNRLKPYADTKIRGSLLENLPENQSLFAALEQMLQFPLRERAKEKLNRQLRSNISDESLATLVVTLYDDNQLCLMQDDEQKTAEPEIICSLGLIKQEATNEN